MTEVLWNRMTAAQPRDQAAEDAVVLLPVRCQRPSACACRRWWPSKSPRSKF